MAYTSFKENFSNISISLHAQLTAMRIGPKWASTELLTSDMVMIKRDWNLRKSRCNDERIIGKYGIGVRCNNGERHIHFADPNNQHSNQTGYILYLSLYEFAPFGALKLIIFMDQTMLWFNPSFFSKLPRNNVSQGLSSIST